MEPPFALTYLPPSLNLPSWLTASTFPTQTTIIEFAFTDELGRSIGLASATITKFSTQIIQLPITVQVDSGVPLSFPYVSEGNTNPTIISVLGASTFISLANDYTSTSIPLQISFESVSNLAPRTSTLFNPVATMLSVAKMSDSLTTSSISSTLINSSPASSIQLPISETLLYSSFSNPFTAPFTASINTQTATSTLANPTSVPAAPIYPTPSSRFSGPAIAGIVSGVIAFGLLLLGLLYCLCSRKGRISSANSNAAEYGSIVDDTESKEILDGSCSRFGSTRGVRGSVWGLGGLNSLTSSSRGYLKTIENQNRRIEENAVLFDSRNIDEFGQEDEGRLDTSKFGLINTLDPAQLFPDSSTTRSRKFVNPVAVEEISESSEGEFGGSDLGLGSRHSDVPSSSNIRFDDIPDPRRLFLSPPNQWTPQSSVTLSKPYASSELMSLPRRYLLPPINTLPSPFLETTLSSTPDPTTSSKNTLGSNLAQNKLIKHKYDQKPSSNLDRSSVGTFGDYKSIARDKSISETNHSHSSSSGANSNVSSVGKASSAYSSSVSANSMRKYESFLEAHSQIAKGSDKRNTLGVFKV